MTVQVVYKNKAKSSNSGAIALFVDENFKSKIEVVSYQIVKFHILKKNFKK